MKHQSCNTTNAVICIHSEMLPAINFIISICEDYDDQTQLLFVALIRIISRVLKTKSEKSGGEKPKNLS